MSLVEKTGLATGTDFARYVVEPRVTRAFDTDKAGLDKLGIFRWFLGKAVELGYPGPNDDCAHFDRALLNKFGGGRGKPGWAERLGKKYYWIFLRQLVGRLADHADRRTWSATFPPSADLQGLDLRDIDPTDIRQLLPGAIADDAWLTPEPYVFLGHDIPTEDALWVKAEDLTNIAQALVVTDPETAVWQVLDMDESWSGKWGNSPRCHTYRHVTRSVRAATCDAVDIKKVTKAFAEAHFDYFNRGPHDYRGYLGEYPRRWPYAHRTGEPITFGSEYSGVTFQHLTLSQLRGREWEYDYNQVGTSKTLLMPSVALVQAGNLRWDLRGGWKDLDDKVQIQDPRWRSNKPEALICRIEYIDHYLRENDFALIILGLQMKFIAGTTKGSGRITERTLFIRHRGKTDLVERHVERD
jgi:hypothetical protein